MDKFEKARNLYYLGLENFENADYENSLQSFIESNKLDEHSRTYARIYECLKKLGKNKEAKAYIEIAYKKNPIQDKVTLQYAEELVFDGKVGLAKEILEKLLIRNATYGPAKRLFEKINKDNFLN
ncbi:hypothetical protein SLL00_10135 [Metabacillus indicus]|uniref:hypothetical protein n=1 Tax=Metabacillus indicus TaxID=246786 RepID=UPI002A0734D1|nr:hypothetical protein [Metabacillus indicus]MDX8289481.1 hypothetical protein [Metabacillus indicus]MDX8290155.1 hypothetical protein [Metabacillus indicus]